MGVFNPLTSLSLFFFLFLLVRPLFADIDSRKTPPPTTTPDIGNIATSNKSSPPPPPSPSLPTTQERPPKFSPFKPSIAVIVGVLTTMFSVTFLILLYAKHCKHGSNFNNNNSNNFYTANTAQPSTARKNSGIDRVVIESLPIFRFGSLRGQKDGLECAVCLNRFDTTEVLKLLPKCKHAFHVECVDTWLDAHSTCPLCRFRIDPEDILLIGDAKILHENQLIPPPPPPQSQSRELDIESGICETTELVTTRRVLGRHSSAGEKGEANQNPNPNLNPTSFRKSLDSYCTKSVAVGCFERPRKDGLLLTTNNSNSSSSEEAAAAAAAILDRTSLDRRLEHRIVVSSGPPAGGGGGGGLHQRWSDVQPSDLLYLRSEMIISDSRRFSSGSRPSSVRRQQHYHHGGYGRSVINERSVSEITGLRRSGNNNINNRQGQEAGDVSRWLAWISSSQSQLDVRSEGTTSDTVV